MWRKSFRKMVVVASAAVVICVVPARGAPLPADHFDDGQLDPALWRVDSGVVTEPPGTEAHAGGGSTGGGSFSSTSSVLFERLTFRLNGVYDSRNRGDYSQYTIGYAGYIGSEWILARTDNAGGGRVLVEVNTPNDGVAAGGVPFTSISTADNAHHDLVFDIQWAADSLLVEIDDLSNGVGVDVSTSTTNPDLIPTTAMAANFNGQGGGEGYNPLRVDWVNVPVPEPASLGLFAAAAATLLLRRRRAVAAA